MSRNSIVTEKNRQYARKRLQELGITDEMIQIFPSGTMQRLNKLPNLGTRAQTLVEVLKTAKENESQAYEIYKAEYRKLSEQIKQKRGQNDTKYNPDEREAIWNKIRETYKHYTQYHRLDTEINRFLLCSYYLHQTPRRCEIGSLELLTPEDLETAVDLKERNYIVLDDKNPKMVISRYKTAKHYGTYAERLHPNFYRDIVDTLKTRPRRYLFASENEDGIEVSKSPNAFTNFVLRTFGVGVSDLRHIYITDATKQATYNERLKIARDMGHSVTQQLLYAYRD
jgi:hypothetical protein